MVNYIVYKIAGNKLWDTQKAKFITSVDNNYKIVSLYNKGELADETYLINVLKNYNFSLGNLLSIEELKKEKLKEINHKYNIATSSLVSTYPSTELLTFDKQEQEARAWLEDNSTETLLVDALAEGRQIEKADLVSRIISKSELFAVQTGYLTGQRQHYEDQLELAKTKEEIEAIVPEYRYYEVGEVGVEA